MIAVGYVAQTVEADGTTTLVLENGRAISISESAATALNEGRQREGLPAIPTVTRSEARSLASAVMAGGSRGELRLVPLVRDEAELISKWRYGPELAAYDGTAAASQDMLDPDNRYHSIRLDGALVGFVCVGADARVAGLPAVAGVDDIGIGLAPDCVGRGLSRWLLPAVIEALEAGGVLSGAVLRAVVLDWNGRSLAAARHAGFAVTGEHRVGARRFIVIARPRTR